MKAKGHPDMLDWRGGLLDSLEDGQKVAITDVPNPPIARPQLGRVQNVGFYKEKTNSRHPS